VLLAIGALWLGIAAGIFTPFAPDRAYYDSLAAPLGFFVAVYLALASLAKRPGRVAPFLFFGLVFLCFAAPLEWAGPAGLALLAASGVFYAFRGVAHA